MYDFAELAAATNAFWRGIGERLRRAGMDGVPTHLSRTPDYASAWWDPGLILGQTCGYPLFSNPENSNNVPNRPRIVATPVYSAPGCKGPRHSSFFIVNAKSTYATLADLRGCACVINGFDSNTGMNLLRAAIAPLAEDSRFFSSVAVTGSHAQSVDRYGGALVSRLNDKQTGSMIAVMQRLHADDLADHLMRQGGWEIWICRRLRSRTRRLSSDAAERICGAAATFSIPSARAARRLRPSKRRSEACCSRLNISRCDLRAEMVHPAPNNFIGDAESAFSE